MSWVLIITALVNGQLVQADRSTYKTKEECLHVLKIVEEHPLFKQYGGKAVCEKAS
jgi:hypothetical protein